MNEEATTEVVEAAPPDRPLRRESVVQKTMGGYILPDHAVDLSAWLRDGLEVYNLFVQMKPMFFQMLEALGGEFTMSGRKEVDDHLEYRVSLTTKEVGTPGDEGYDHLTTATLTPATGITEDFAPIEPLDAAPATLPNPDGLRCFAGCPHTADEPNCSRQPEPLS